MRRFQSINAFNKYRPYQNPWQRFWHFWKKRKTKKMPTVKVTEIGKFSGNPYKKAEKIKKRIGYGSKISLLFIISSAWLGLLMYLPYFQIKRIEYNGLENIHKNELYNYLNTNFFKHNRVIPWKNYFLVNCDKIAKKVEINFPVQRIEVKKYFPDKIEITLKEKISTLIYDNGNNYYLLDSDGDVIKYLTKIGMDEFKIIQTVVSSTKSTTTNFTASLASSTSSTNRVVTSSYHVPNFQKIQKQFGKYPLLYDKRNLNITGNQFNDAIPSNYVTNILNWNSQLIEKGIARPLYFIMENIGAGIQIKTEKPWDIYFQPNDDLTTQLNRLKIILKDNKPWQYIDLRYGERVYWK